MTEEPASSTKRRVLVLARRMRAFPPLNWFATSLVRGVLRASGRESEWLIRHLHRVGGVTVSLPNGRFLRLWSRGDDWISNQVFWRGWAGHEPETTRVFFALARRARATIDVGAYVGYYTLLAALANPAGRVLALEPLPAIHSRLLRHVSRNRLSNVECLQAAAGGHQGWAPFYHLRRMLPTSSSLSPEFMSDHHDVASTQVPLVTLDHLVRERSISRLDLLKIDTESTEPDVLEGAREVLARDRPWIVCEVLRGRGAEGRLEPILEPFGYRYFLLTPDGPLPRTSIVGHARWLNYLFVSRGDEIPQLSGATERERSV